MVSRAATLKAHRGRSCLPVLTMGQGIPHRAVSRDSAPRCWIIKQSFTFFLFFLLKSDRSESLQQQHFRSSAVEEQHLSQYLLWDTRNKHLVDGTWLSPIPRAEQARAAARECLARQHTVACTTCCKRKMKTPGRKGKFYCVWRTTAL